MAPLGAKMRNPTTTTMLKKKKRATAAPPTARDVPLEERLRQKKNGFAIFPSNRDQEQQQQQDDDEADASDNDPPPTTSGVKGKPSKYGPSAASSDADGKMKRSSKNHPLEITSKRQVARFKNVVEVKKKRLVDPRFDSLSGRFNEDLFAKSYAFLDEYKVCRPRCCGRCMIL